MRRDCTAGKLSECNEASDEEMGNVMRRGVRRRVRKCNWSCAATAGIALLDLEMGSPLTGRTNFSVCPQLPPLATSLVTL